jgi:putative ABC transport system substrate-binding protein
VTTRRDLLIAFGASVLAAPLTPLAQQQGKVWRIGFFYLGTRQSALDTGRYGAFLQGMRELGYVEGKHYVLEERYAPSGDDESLNEIAAELVRSKVDIIVCTGGNIPRALKRVTTTVPVVVTVSGNPVEQGLAANLARPGGNFTGLSAVLDEIYPKHIELLKTTLPKLSRIAVLARPRNLNHPNMLKRMEDVARKMAIQISHIDVETAKDFEPGFGKLARERADALIILGDAFVVQHFSRISALAIKYRVPSIYSGREYPEAGGLMSYGPNFVDNFHRAATYVDKILKGAKPGELPFEQPTRYYLVINRKTAAALKPARDPAPR